MTLDKFLKIVCATRPNIRLGKRSILLSLILSWCSSAIFALLPVFKVAGMSYTIDIEVIPLPNDNKEQSVEAGISDGTQIFLMVVQLTSMLLYLPIFMTAKRSGASVGIKREAKVARKIALLVFTNLILFTVPLLLGILQYNVWLSVFSDVASNLKHHTLAQYQWLRFVIFSFPLSCVSINSVFNPFLYTFRHPKIKQRLKDVFFRPIIAMSGHCTSRCPIPRRSGRTIQPAESYQEMQRRCQTQNSVNT